MDPVSATSDEVHMMLTVCMQVLTRLVRGLLSFVFINLISRYMAYCFKSLGSDVRYILVLNAGKYGRLTSQLQQLTEIQDISCET